MMKCKSGGGGAASIGMGIEKETNDGREQNRDRQKTRD